MESEENPGVLKDFDLIYPEGFGEAISGGEREHRYEKAC
jgi:asparaginyl-tRNA synthetase